MTDETAQREFTCDMCGETFPADVSEEQLRSEFEQYFPSVADTPSEDLASVCDDCWEKIHPERN